MQAIQAVDTFPSFVDWLKAMGKDFETLLRRDERQLDELFDRYTVEWKSARKEAGL